MLKKYLSQKYPCLNTARAASKRLLAIFKAKQNTLMKNKRDAVKQIIVYTHHTLAHETPLRHGAQSIRAVIHTKCCSGLSVAPLLKSIDLPRL